MEGGIKNSLHFSKPGPCQEAGVQMLRLLQIQWLRTGRSFCAVNILESGWGKILSHT